MKIIDIMIDIYIDIFNKVLHKKKLKGNFVNKNDTISELINNNKSIIRFGDGESSIYFGYDLYFQKNDKYLSNRMKTIFSHCQNDERFIFCMTHERFSESINEMFKRKINRYNVWKKSRYLFVNKVKNNICYDAYIFKGLELEQYNLIVNKILSFNNIIVVSSIPGIVENFFNFYCYNGNLFQIQIKEVNAFSEYDKISCDINNLIKECCDANILVLVSCGPLAKILCYDLTINNYIVYDVGKFFSTEFTKFHSY